MYLSILRVQLNGLTQPSIRIVIRIKIRILIFAIYDLVRRLLLPILVIISIRSSVPGEGEHVRSAPLVTQAEHRTRVTADGLIKRNEREGSRTRRIRKMSSYILLKFEKLSGESENNSNNSGQIPQQAKYRKHFVNTENGVISQTTDLQSRKFKRKNILLIF